MGHYQALVRLAVTLDHDSAEASGYFRTLDIEDAVATTSYTVPGHGTTRVGDRTRDGSPPRKALAVHAENTC